MGKFSVVLHGLGLGKGKYKRYQGTFIVDKSLDYLTEQFELNAIGGVSTSVKGGYGSAWKFQNAVRVDENTHIFTITLPLEFQKKQKNFDPDNLRLNDEIRFCRIGETKTEVSVLVHDNETYDADYIFECRKKFISNL